MKTYMAGWVFGVVVVGALSASAVTEAGTIYVDFNASGNNDGTSWEDAFTDLQDAITECASDEIWVAAATYKPDASDRGVSFVLKNNCAIYGGFVGDETSLSQRDPKTNETILSGDLSGDDGPAAFEDNDENSYHVVIGSNTDATAILDGFTIKRGNADGTGANQDEGGGLFADSGTPRIANCRFTENHSKEGGGAYFEDGSDALMVRCIFDANRSTGGPQAGRGGAMCIASSSPKFVNCEFKNNDGYDGGVVYLGRMTDGASSDATFTNCLFFSNVAEDEGGAVYSGNSEPTFSNCTFRDNDATSAGGIKNVKDLPIFPPVVTVVNSIFWGNTHNGTADETQQLGVVSSAVNDVTYSDIQDCNTGSGGLCESAGDYNIDDDPRFVSASDSRVDSFSPTIDLGSDSAIPADVADLDGDSNTSEATPLDLDENARESDGDGVGGAVVDMGPYEFRCNVNGDCEQDANPCTSHDCVSNGCKTVNKPFRTDCDDGLFCNGDDECNGQGSCTHAGDPCTSPDLCCETDDTCYDPTANPPEHCGAQ